MAALVSVNWLLANIAASLDLMKLKCHLFYSLLRTFSLLKFLCKRDLRMHLMAIKLNLSIQNYRELKLHHIYQTLIITIHHKSIKLTTFLYRKLIILSHSLKINKCNTSL